MGLLNHDDRQSPQRAVRTPDKGAARTPDKRLRHPGRRAAPRPVNAAESDVLEGISGGSRGRAIGGRRVNRAGGHASVPTYLPIDDDRRARQEPPSAQVGAKGRAQLGGVIGQSESEAFAVHLDAKPALRRPRAPAPGAPDPAPELERIERELGIVALAASLEAYGTPPVAPM